MLKLRQLSRSAQSRCPNQICRNAKIFGLLGAPVALRSSVVYRSYAVYRGFDKQPLTPFQFNSYNWNKTGKFFAFAGIAGLVIYVSNLEEAPYSHRRRFMIVSKNVEKYVGQQGYQETMQEFGHSVLPDYHPEVIRVKKIMKKLISAANIDHQDWKIHVISDRKAPPNAFVLPGGKVFVFQSILPICKNDDGLATVLAHETGHQIARHTAESLSKTPIYMLLGMILYTITGSSNLNRILISSALQLPASREMEREADYIGLMLMSKACFNPQEAVGLWQRMSQYEQQMGRQTGAGMVPEFLNTHPTSKHRIDLIKGWLPEAEIQRENANCQTMTARFHDFQDWAPMKWS